MSFTLLKSGSFCCASDPAVKNAHAAMDSERESRDVCFRETRLSEHAFAFLPDKAQAFRSADYLFGFAILRENQDADYVSQ